MPEHPLSQLEAKYTQEDRILQNLIELHGQALTPCKLLLQRRMCACTHRGMFNSQIQVERIAGQFKGNKQIKTESMVL